MVRSVSGQTLGLGGGDPVLVWPARGGLPARGVTLSSSRKMGTVMKRMMSRVWIMMMPSFSVFRRFSWFKELNPGGRRGAGTVKLGPHGWPAPLETAPPRLSWALQSHGLLLSAAPPWRQGGWAGS